MIIFNKTNFRHSIQLINLDTAGLFSLCALAMCTNYGTATVSLTKFIVLCFFVVQIFFFKIERFKAAIKTATTTSCAIVIAVSWMTLSSTWSIAPLPQLFKALYGHLRWLWFFPFLYICHVTNGYRQVLRWLMYGQFAILSLSVLLAIGFEIPYTKHNLGDEFGVVFTSHLEQPIMTTVLLILLWSQKNEWMARLGNYLFYIICSLSVIDVLFVVKGRTGYMVMLCFFALEIRKTLPTKLKAISFLIPLFIGWGAYFAIPSFHEKVGEIYTQTAQYDEQHFDSSAGLRLDMWRRALMGIKEAPFTGHGVGSYPEVYKLEGGWSPLTWYQPHQQYLLWWNDAGIIGLILYCSIFLTIKLASRLTSTSNQMAFNHVLITSLLVGLLNCPFYGVGTGEFFIIIFTCLAFDRIRDDPT